MVAKRDPAGPTPSWTWLPDVLLEREALVMRARRGVPADALAGLRIDDAEVDRLLGEMTGGGPPSADADELAAKYEDLVVEARSSLEAALATDSPFARVVRSARLDAGGAEVLALLCAVELEPRRQKLVAYVQDDVTRRHPTLHTLARLFPPPSPGPRAVSPDSRLVRAALVDVTTDQPWASNSARVPPAVLWAVVGDPSLDADLPDDVEVIDGPGSGTEDLVLVWGADRTRRLQAALGALPADRCLVLRPPGTPEGTRALVRQATVSALGVVLELEESLDGATRRLVERSDHLPWALCSPWTIPIDEVPRRPWTERPAGAPEATDEEWAAVFAGASRTGHRLTAEQLRLAATAHQGGAVDPDAAVRRLASGPLERLARRIQPRRSWDQLVLPGDHLTQLRELADRYRNRDVVHGEWGVPAYPSAGVVGLFSGPSGTGKTLAAEVLAGELGVDLYKIDLSSVVSKYIGETEKNLERIFSTAATGNLVLLFDEADALFGKRSEVTDARDRYANIEVSYLLQRLEGYDGLVVLTTNFRKNIDEAFLRRLHVAIDFPMPAVTERRRIWEQSLEGVPLAADVDVGFVAERFELAGGSIRNAALAATFLAAEAGDPVSMTTVILALKREFQKLGRLRTAEDFGPYHDLVRDLG